MNSKTAGESTILGSRLLFRHQITLEPLTQMSRSERENRERFQDLLRDLFQFDAADLDFGIYRVMNQRRDTIERFIEEELLAAVDESLETLADAERKEIEAELDRVTAELNEKWDEDIFAADGSLKEPYDELDQENLVAYRDLREQRENVAVAEETESRVFSDLYRFFARYYEDGDFHTKRRISGTDAKYAVPYNGEETHFHWANRDQYYVKSGEHFVDYRFDAEDLSVEFRLEAADVPHDDVKGDDRYFVLGRGDPVTLDAEEGTCTITFQYRKITEDEAEEFVADYNTAADDDRSSFAHMTVGMRCAALEERILDRVENPTIQNALTAPADADREDPPTHLAKNLRRYVSENSMDYFVHKDLESFLEGELKFFLQNEVLDVDDLLAGGTNESRAVLRARTVRSIAERIITFLAQIEEFQKRLFEKKKFVVQTDYMVTVDQVPDWLYDRVLDNEAQLEQWREVYNTDKWDTSLAWNGEFDQRFLGNHPHVMVDTALFDTSFKRDLLSAFEDIEAAIDGVIVNSGNFQALNLLYGKYAGQVSCTYIDPPYNTGNDGFLYKDQYQHSSWLSLLKDRVGIGKQFLSEDGLFFSSIDSNELSNYTQLLNETFSEQISTVAVRNNPKGRGLDRYLSTSHDYLLCYANEQTELQGIPKSEGQIAEQYPQEDEDGRYRFQPLRNTHRQFNSETRPNLWYPLYVEETTRDVYLEPGSGREEVFPVWNDGLEGCWTWDQDKVAEDRELLVGKESGGRWKVYRKDYARQNGTEATYTPKTIWDDNNLRTDYAQQLLDSVMGGREFRSPKPPALIERTIQLSSGNGEYVLDFFAGSGTTAHAAMNLNRENDTNHGYILVDTGDHLDDVARERIQKIAYTNEWENGTPQEQDGISHLVKYHRLESYEDALNNITLEEPEGLDRYTEETDDYVEGYLLDFESRESAPLLPEGTFAEPFDHELKIEQGGTSRESTPVDLVETFHYLLGADMRQYHHETHQDRTYVVTECEVETESGFETVLTAWRRRADLDLDREAEWFDETFESTTYDRVYMNGESQVARAEPLEITFRERMEAGPNVA